jgi:hypothetical protein
MKSERILSLDMSTKTGWALMVSSESGVALEAYGKIPQIHTPDGEYPGNFIVWAREIFWQIVKIVDDSAPDVLVIEETASGSKAIYTQKILEWIHFLVADMITQHQMKAVYLLTEQWRRETGCLMSKEESKRNKQVREYKKKNATTIAYDIEGKRIGKITRKHVNIRRANEVFGSFLTTPLRKKDEDTADSLLLGYCYHLRRMKENELF